MGKPLSVISSYPLFCPTDGPPQKRKPYALRNVSPVYPNFMNSLPVVAARSFSTQVKQPIKLGILSSPSSRLRRRRSNRRLPFPPLRRTPPFAWRPMFRCQLYLPLFVWPFSSSASVFGELLSKARQRINGSFIFVVCFRIH